MPKKKTNTGYAGVICMDIIQWQVQNGTEYSYERQLVVASYTDRLGRHKTRSWYTSAHGGKAKTIKLAAAWRKDMLKWL
jgi:hypothetical protein